MELSLALRKAYFAALSPVIESNGSAVQFFDGFAPSDSQNFYPYVILSSQTDTQTDVKKYKNYNATILLDIVTGSTQPIGREQAEIISSQIDDVIIDSNFNDLDLSAFGYTIIDTTRESAFDSFDKNDIYYIYRKLIRYSHIISKL